MTMLSAWWNTARGWFLKGDCFLALYFEKFYEFSFIGVVDKIQKDENSVQGFVQWTFDYDIAGRVLKHRHRRTRCFFLLARQTDRLRDRAHGVGVSGRLLGRPPPGGRQDCFQFKACMWRDLVGLGDESDGGRREPPVNWNTPPQRRALICQSRAGKTILRTGTETNWPAEMWEMRERTKCRVIMIRPICLFSFVLSCRYFKRFDVIL